MYIASTINPLTKSSEDIPILLLCYEQTRRFIARPKHYADLVHITSEKLNLDPDAVPTFHISTLDICKGLSVEVDESAYHTMCTSLDELTVTVDVVKQEPAHEQSRNQDVEKAKTPQAPPTPPPTREENRKVKAVSRIEVVREEDEIETGPSPSAYAEAKSSHTVVKSQGRGESVLTRALDLLDKEVTVMEEADGPEEEEEEETQDNTSGSGSKGNMDRTNALFEELEIISHPSPPKTSSREITTTNKTSRKSISVTVTGKLPTPGPSNSGSESSSTRPAEVKPDPEERFNVIISGPGPDQEAEFKTRGKHIVKKVLAGACKTFGLDLARAHLIVPKLVNGEIEYFECHLEQTMARCGVETGKKFFIHMDEEVDELEDE